jgi:hypothetical protein
VPDSRNRFAHAGTDEPVHARRRPRRRAVIAALSALGLLVAGVVFAQFALAGNRPNTRDSRYPWLIDASKIPNDQGPSKECAGTPAPTATAMTAPTDPATTDPPTTDPASTDPATTDGPTADPTSSVDSAAAGPATAAAHQHGGGGTPDWCHTDQGGPLATDYIDIRQVQPNAKTPARGRNASSGLFVSVCGRNENNHHNSDNFIVAPGVTNGAHHTHDYVGNVSTDGNSTNQSLAAAGTTCRRNDQSAYYWPVLRQRGTRAGDQNADGGGNDLNVGKIIEPSSVSLVFKGNATSKVVAMPRFLRIITGDAKATTNGPTNARAQWTCTGFGNRLTTKYPLCPRGSQVQRVLVLPSCWDGSNTDSANHRSHIVFPDKTTGACPVGTKAVPELHMTLTYTVPPGRSFSLDSFPDQLHNPLTDHADFEDVMPDALMANAVDCINRGRLC